MLSVSTIFLVVAFSRFYLQAAVLSGLMLSVSTGFVIFFFFFFVGSCLGCLFVGNFLRCVDAISTVFVCFACFYLYAAVSGVMVLSV
jgi:hypothetical protein